MKVTQISIGRFHHFHLARQLEKYNCLDSIYTGYPKFKLRDENGIPSAKIKTFPWIQVPYMGRGKIGLDRWEWLNNKGIWYSTTMLDKYVASKIIEPGILFSLSGTGLYSGKKMQQLQGYHICDRGSSHICYQNDILKEEFDHWGVKFNGIDSQIIERGEIEYEQADYITIPSEFVKQSFIKKGIDEHKIIKIPYGARLGRFKKSGDPPKTKFRVLWVGGVSIRKGFIYALEAFQKLEHPNKEFIVIGSIEKQMQKLLNNRNLNNVEFMGLVPNKDLVSYYSTSHVFLLTSLEEGLAMVQGEALACGCPVIATTNTGAADLFNDGMEGFIVPIRNVWAMTEKLQLLADKPDLRHEMSKNALMRVKGLGGWDTYGENMTKFLNNLIIR